MLKTTARGVVVRNDNDSITYNGEWTSVQASTVNNLVNLINGSPVSPTLRSTTATSSFIFPFHGTSVQVIGSINLANLSDGSQDPSWTCAVDGIVLSIPDLSSVNRQNLKTLCSRDSITDGAHELVVNATSKGRPFYLDYLEYKPSPNVPLDNSFVFISNTDVAVDFISGWRNIGIRNGTTDPASLVNVSFIGVQLAWYGYTPFAESHHASSGEYSVDGQPYTSFQLPGLAPQFSATAFNRLFFTTPMLDMGAHVLSAKYTGSPGQTPFTFEYLIVTNGSFSSPESSPTSSGESPSGGTGRNPSFHPTGAPSTDDTGKESPHVGSIVGSVVGTIGGIVLCLTIIFCSRLRKRKCRDRYNARRIIEPYFAQPQLIDISQSPVQGENSGAGLQWEPGEAATISDSILPSYHSEYI